MTSIDDHQNEDGTTNWAALRKAEENNGQRCITCGTFMTNIALFSDKDLKYARECVSCEQLVKNDGEVDHDERVRCPKCRHIMVVHDMEDYETYREDEHSVSCDECDHDFEIQTYVTYSFSSPAMLKEPKEEAHG